RGRVQSASTVSLQIERDLRRMAAEVDDEAFLVTVNPEVAFHLIGSCGEVIDEIERRFRRAVYVRASEHMHIEKYEINPGDIQEMERHMLPWKKGDIMEVTVARNPFSMLPRASAWLDGYLVELENGGKHVGKRVKAKLGDIHRSYAFGEVVANEKSHSR
ncbi:MAG TPA: hypothetical protein VHV83_12880, partial [Armatimonadota bacterium]|nr:hypothetical protein [Armatimonadota bacterium]